MDAQILADPGESHRAPKKAKEPAGNPRVPETGQLVRIIASDNPDVPCGTILLMFCPGRGHIVSHPGKGATKVGRLLQLVPKRGDVAYQYTVEPLPRGSSVKLS